MVLKIRKNETGNIIGVILFLIPALVLFVAFFIYPVIHIAITSFTQWDGMSDPIFNGINNYIKIFKDKVFIRSIVNNVIWALVAGFLQVPLAMFTALMLAQKPKGWKIMRTVYFLPQVISGVALATMWSAVYNAQYGLLNGLLELIGLGKYSKNWLGTVQTAFPAILIYWVFYVGYYMVIMLADIQTVPEDYYEAAAIDGASKLRMSFSITVPLIKNSIFTCMTLAMVFGLRQFEQVYMLTDGGPANRTSVMVLYLYKEMQKYSYGTSSAAAMILIIVGSAVIIGLRILEKATDK